MTAPMTNGTKTVIHKPDEEVTREKNHALAALVSKNPGRPPTPAEYRELIEKQKRLELALEISKQFNNTLDVNKLMRTILDEVALVLNAEACSFWMKDGVTKENVCHSSVGPVKDKITGMRLKKGQGIVGWVIDNKEKAVVFDVTLDNRFLKNVDEKTRFDTKSILCVPLIVNQNCVGAISLLNKKTPDGRFNQADLEMLELLAMSGAIAVKNAQLFQSERRIRELTALLDISKEITSTLDLDRVLLSIVNLASQVIHFKRAVIGLADADNRIVLAAESNMPRPDAGSRANKALLPIMKFVFDADKPIHIENFNAIETMQKIPESIIAYMKEEKLLCLTIMVFKDAEGKLGVISMEGIYTSLVVQESDYVIHLVVNHATIAIRNAQLYQKIPAAKLGERFKSGMINGKKAVRKLIIVFVILAALSAMLLTVNIPHNISGDVEIIPVHTTRVTSQIDGLVNHVFFREGDLVKEGQPLIEFNSSLLLLEKSKLIKDLRIAESDLRRLESDGQPFEVYLKKLEIEKLKSEADLLDKKLSFTVLKAVTGGRILTPKPEELVNKMVVKGEVIAEIASEDLKMGKVILNEENILDIKSGMNVQVTLKSMPHLIYDGKLDYVSHTKEIPEDNETVPGYIGFFRSEALSKESNIRFGMTGIAKIRAGDKPAYDIYLKPVIERIKTRYKMLTE